MVLQPTADFPAGHEGQTRDLREEQHQQRGSHARGCDECETGLDTARMRGRRRNGRHRCQRCTVEEAHDDQGQADRAEPGGLLAGAAAYNRDADGLVEAAREGDSAHRGGAAGGGECQGLRALVLGEEALPAPGLEGVREEKEDPGCDHEQGIGVGERPAGMDEMEHGQHGSGQRAGDEDGVDCDSDSPRGREAACSPHARRYRELREKAGDANEGEPDCRWRKPAVR